MDRRVSAAVWVETATSAVAGLLAIVTLVWRDWIEAVFGADPDHHGGSFEWAVAIGCAAVAVGLALLARSAYLRQNATDHPIAPSTSGGGDE